MLAFVRFIMGESDSTNSYFTDAQAQTQINHSQVHVANEVPCLLTYKEVTAIADQVKYGLPAADFLQLKDIELHKDPDNSDRVVPLQRVSFDEFKELAYGNIAKSGEPAYYKVEFGAVTTASGPNPPGDFWPYPVSDNAVDVFRVYFYQKPTDISTWATDVSELPEILHESVCYHAAWHLALHKANAKKVNQFAAMYKDSINIAKDAIVNKRDRTGPHRIKDVMGYSLSGTTIPIIRRGPLR